MENKIKTIIVKSIKEFNATADQEEILSIKDENEIIQLYGSDTSLDSMGLVSLIVLIENNIEDELGKVISIVSEKALSQKRSPFQDSVSLCDFIISILKDEEDGIK